MSKITFNEHQRIGKLKQIQMIALILKVPPIIKPFS